MHSVRSWQALWLALPLWGALWLGGTQARAAQVPCDLGDSRGLSSEEAVKRLERCVGSGGSIPAGPARERLGATSSDAASPSGVARQRLLGITRATAGHATAVVAVSCPSALGSPCFDHPDHSIQDAIDALVAAHPEDGRTVLITPGVYRQAFTTSHGWNGATHLLGMAASGLLAPAGVIIEAPDDGVASTAWRLGGRGSLANLSFTMGADPGDRGFTIGGIIAVELSFENVSLLGTLAPGARGIEVFDITGFLTLHSSSVLLSCEGGDGNSAAFFVDQPQRPFTEITIQGGHYQIFSMAAPGGCATFELEATPFGDDGHGTAIENIHLQCEASATCFELNGDGVRLELGPLVFRRSPSGQLVRVRGSGSSSVVFLHGITAQLETSASQWGNVVPHGTMTIVGAGEPSAPVFPGWTFKRQDGGPGTSTYLGEGSPGPPFRWRAVQTAP